MPKEKDTKRKKAMKQKKQRSKGKRRRPVEMISKAGPAILNCQLNSAVQTLLLPKVD
jgi:hypothetical protein